MASLSIGSPNLEVKPWNQLIGFALIFLSNSTTCSARNKPKVVAFTNKDGELLK